MTFHLNKNKIKTLHDKLELNRTLPLQKKISLSSKQVYLIEYRHQKVQENGQIIIIPKANLEKKKFTKQKKTKKMFFK